MIKEFPTDFHTNLEIRIGEEWKLVDATWDDKLMDAGFPETKQWNGTESTINAVYAKNVYQFNSMVELADFLKSKVGKDHDVKNEGQFIQALNNYFKTLRN